MVSILISFNYFSTNICFHLHIYIFVKLGLILSDSFVAFFSLYNLHLHFNGCMIHLNVVSQMLTDGLVVLSFLTNMGIISCFRKRGHVGHPWKGVSSLKTERNWLLQSGDEGDCRAKAPWNVSGWKEGSIFSAGKGSLKKPLVCWRSYHTPEERLQE